MEALCTLGLSPGELVPPVLAQLHEIVPSARNLFDFCDTAGRLTHYYVEGPVDPDVAAHYFAEFHNRREAECMPRFDSLACAPMGVRGAASLETPGFYRSALYNEVWRPQGLRSRIEAVLRDSSGGLQGSLVLYRGPGERAFDAQDEQTLARLLPTIARGLERGGPRADAYVEADEPAETLLLTLEGRVSHVSGGAARMLMLARGGELPVPGAHTLEALVSRHLPQIMGSLARGEREGHFELDSRFGRFRLRATLLKACVPGLEAGVLVRLCRMEPCSAALVRGLDRLGLTPGQARVCRMVLEGASQAEIAGALGVAVSTVVDHVRKAYQGLDVHSVAELRALLDRGPQKGAAGISPRPADA